MNSFDFLTQDNMKKIFLTLILLQTLSIGSILAQKGFEAGIAVQYSSVWIYNQTDFDKGPELDLKPTYGLSYGANLSYGFAPRHGFRVGYFMSEQGQIYSTDDRFTKFPNQKFLTKLTYTQIPFQYRYTSDLTGRNTAFMICVGPQFGMLKKATATSLSPAIIDTVTNDTSYTIKPSEDVLKNFNSLDISAAVSLGMIARFTEQLHMNATLNIAYSISDIEASATKAPNRVASRNAVVGIQVGFYYLFNGPPMVHKPKLR
jgi:hypothetical protein